MTASDSAKPGPHIHFFLIQGLRVRVEMGTKSEKVCVDVYFTLYLQGVVTSIYGALMLLNFCGGGLGLELNILGFQIEENFCEAKF